MSDNVMRFGVRNDTCQYLTDCIMHHQQKSPRYDMKVCHPSVNIYER